MEFRKSEKSAKILKISGFWHFFRFQNSTFKYLYRPCRVCQLFLFFCPLLCRSMWPPWQEKWRDFAWPAKVLKSGIFLDLKKITIILQSLRFCHLLQIFKIPLLNTLKANQSVSIFWTRIFFFVYIRQAGDYSELGTRVFFYASRSRFRALGRSSSRWRFCTLFWALNFALLCSRFCVRAPRFFALFSRSSIFRAFFALLDFSRSYIYDPRFSRS